MTTLIFVTRDDASPLIHLQAADVEVLQALSFGTGKRNAAPGIVAVAFLREIGSIYLDAWLPTLESTPIFNEEAAWDAAEDIYEDMIVWNVTTWQETTPAKTPTTIEFET